jgi:hypothetical protein
MTNTDDFLDMVMLALQRVKNCNKIRNKLMMLSENSVFEGNPHHMDLDLFLKYVHAEIKSMLDLIDFE